MKTVTEIRRSSACDTESVYLVLNSLLDWKLVEKTETGVMWSLLRFVVVVLQYEASSTVLYATKVLDRGSRQVRKERTAVVKA